MLTHLTDTIVHLAEMHSFLAYLLAFLLTGAEAFPVVGALVPGTAIVIALGALVPTGALHFWPLVSWVTAGAVLGDGLPFWFGHRYRDQATRIWPLCRHPRLLPQGQAFFEQHGGSSIIIARFTPGVRAVAPIVAGISGMRPIRFYILDVVSAVLWAPAHVTAGVLVGASLTILGAVAGRLEAIFIGFIVGLGLLLFLLPRLLRILVARLAALREPILIWSRARDTRFRHTVASLLDPAKTELSGLLMLACVLAGSLWLFLGVLQDMIAGDPLVYADRAILHFFEPYRTGLAVEIAIVLARLGSGPVTLAVAAVVLVWLDQRRAWRATAYGIAAVIGASLFSAGLDLALRRPPPSPMTPGWSLIPFPGGDLATASALYGFLTVIAASRLGVRHRMMIMIMTALFIAMQLGSRVYLGIDWLSSELAAAAFGFAWAASLGLAYVVRPIEPVPPWSLVTITAAIIAITGIPAVVLNRHADIQRYEVGYAGSVITCDAWQSHGWETLPARSLDMLGGFVQPLSVQWVGRVDALRKALVREGWRTPPVWTFRNALTFLAPHATPSEMPTLPRWDNGRRSDLVMVLTGHGLASDERLVLRIWKSGVYVIAPDGRVLTLKIGEIEKQRLRRMFATLTIPDPEGFMASILPVMGRGLPAARLVARGSDGSPVLLAGASSAKIGSCFITQSQGRAQ